MDVRSLFKLVGESGHDRTRVEDALEWLLSPLAEGIGHDLLEAAHALRGRPLEIEISSIRENGYHGFFDQHRIVINPKQIDKIVIKDGNHVRPMSVECCLAHELQHAGETQNKEDAIKKASLEFLASATLGSRDNGHGDHMRKLIADAVYYETASRRLEEFVDSYLLPLQKKIKAYLLRDVDYVGVIFKTEQRAMDIENRVAALRGEPLRRDYMDSLEISDSDWRQLLIDDIADSMNLKRKPRVTIGWPVHAGSIEASQISR